MISRTQLLCSTILCGAALLSAQQALADKILNADQDYTVTSDVGTADNTIIIGDTSGPATFNVTGSGALVTTSGIFGYFGDADGNTGLIEGNWTNNGTITVGNFGGDNTLTIQKGGDVSSQSTWIGGEPSSTGNSVIVAGNGSTLNNSTDLTVGYGSADNTLTIRNGATSTNDLAYIGWSAAADDNTLTVTGDGSTLTVAYDGPSTATGVLYLGHDGSGNRLNVLDQGSVIVGADLVIGEDEGADNNILTISGADSTVDIAGRLAVGRSGNGNSVIVEQGGTLISKDGRIGGGGGGQTEGSPSNSTVTINGAGSSWTLSGSLRIGEGVGGGTSNNNALRVENGGVVTLTGTSSTFIGYGSNDKGNELIVTGEGSKYVTGGNITVGNTGSQSLLEITNGGLVQANGSGRTVTVKDGNTLRVGPGGSLEAATLALENNSLTQVAIDFEDPVSILLGAATLDGDLDAIVGPKGILGNRYSLLTTTNTIITEFDDVDVIGLSPNLSYTYETSNTERWLTFSMDLGGGGDFNENQQNVADALDDYFNAGGIFAPGFGVLASLTGEELADGLSQASGEVGATGGSSAVEQATTAFLGLMMQGKGPGRTEANMAAAPMGESSIMPTADVIAADSGWTMWGGVYGGTASLPGDDALGSHDTDTDILGIATGWDYEFADDATLGFAIAGGGTRWDLDESLGSGDSTFLQLGAHGEKRFGSSYLWLAGAYAWHWMDTERTVTISDPETLDADFTAGNLAGRIEGGHRFGADGLGFTPYAAFQAQAVYMPEYEEDGGDFAVAYEDETATAARSELGLRLDMAADAVRLNAGLAWAHDWRSDAEISASFVSLSGTSFIVNGADAPDDVALVSAGAEFGVGAQSRLSASFDGEFGEDYASYGGAVAFIYAW